MARLVIGLVSAPQGERLARQSLRFRPFHGVRGVLKGTKGPSVTGVGNTGTLRRAALIDEAMLIGMVGDLGEVSK